MHNAGKFMSLNIKAFEESSKNPCSPNVTYSLYRQIGCYLFHLQKYKNLIAEQSGSIIYSG